MINVNQKVMGHIKQNKGENLARKTEGKMKKEMRKQVRDQMGV